MAKVKLTKTALKQERDALKQFERFLPTLQLKKQQLQMEMRHCLDQIEQNEAREEASKNALRAWVSLFGDDTAPQRVADRIRVKAIRTESANIAGVAVPKFHGVDFEDIPCDLFLEEPWQDDAVDAVKQILEIREEREIIREQYRLIGQELRTTTQRVNLFEKVKIPETKENIRIIQIAIGDAQTSAVVRSKIAKKKLQGEEGAA
ncbi:MAG: V-type ATP synthase subunit D [Lentisphaeria bacterium]|nr:V-type ATP synthase subunit D [Lentisphaeria bacterium]